MECSVGVSNRHVHLNKEVWSRLFGDEDMVVRNYLKQPGQYASTSTIDIIVNGKVLEHLRVVGPFRDYNQVEISLSDAKEIGVVPPRRQSGVLDGSLPVCLIGPCGRVYLDNGLILADAHIHLDKSLADSMCYSNYDEVGIYKNNVKVMDAKVKISDGAFVELHIDKDEEVLFDLHSGDVVEFR